MDVEELRAAWHRATEKDRPQDAVKALVALERLEPNEPRWSQRLGESYRRVGQTKDAVDAFVRAFERYFERGFLPRAIAMAKLVRSLDAARGDLLEKSLPQGGVPPPLPFDRPFGTAPKAPEPARTVPPPLPAAAASRPHAPPPPPPSLPRLVKAAPLSRAPDALPDEVRFLDEPDSSIEILLVEFSPSDVVTIDADADDEPPTMQLVAPKKSAPAPAPYDAYGAMASFRLFASLSRDALLALSNAAEVVEFVSGAMIIVKDEQAFALYAIVSGNAKVSVTGGPEVELAEGDIFGESSLLDEGKRQADVRADGPLMTLRIEKAALRDVVAKFPEVEDALFDLLARRLITNLMFTSKLFAAFNPAVRLELAQKFEVRRAESGTVIAERGRRSDGLYILLAGNVMAESEGEAPIRIARGTAFGHASLLGGAASTTVRTATEAVLLRMSAAGFGALAALYPPALAHLAETANEPLPMSRREP